MPPYLSVVGVIYNPMIVSIFITPTAPPTCSSYDFLTETGGQQKHLGEAGSTLETVLFDGDYVTHSLQCFEGKR